MVHVVRGAVACKAKDGQTLCPRFRQPWEKEIDSSVPAQLPARRSNHTEVPTIELKPKVHPLQKSRFAVLTYRQNHFQLSEPRKMIMNPA